MLATTSLGALWSSCSPDFGPQGVLDRFGQIEPKVLITADGYSYHGKKLNLLDRIDEISRSIPKIERVVIVPFLGGTSSLPNRGMHWDDLLDRSVKEIEFAQLPFDHPVYIMYSSGTTGNTKVYRPRRGGDAPPALQRTCASHRSPPRRRHLLLHHLRLDDVELAGQRLCRSARPSSSTTAAPRIPISSVLWHAVDEHKITVFGTIAQIPILLRAHRLPPRSTRAN